MPARPQQAASRRPSLDDYLTPEQQDRLARVLVGVLVSAAEERAKLDAGRPPSDDADTEAAS